MLFCCYILELSINDRDDDEGADIVGVKTILPGKQMKTLDGNILYGCKSY